MYEGEELTRFIDHAHIVLSEFYSVVRRTNWGRARNTEKDKEVVTALLMDMNQHIHKIGEPEKTELNENIERVKSYVNVVSTLPSDERIEKSDVLSLLDRCLQKIKQGHINNLMR